MTISFDPDRDLAPDALALMQAHAIRAYPEESIGIVTAGRYVACRNVHPDPVHFAELDTADYLSLLDQGTLQAIVHSHPNGTASPSRMDMAQQLAIGVTFGVMASRPGAASLPIWRGDALPVAPLVGRSFVPGVWDCYSLIRDYYRTTRGVTLPEVPRDDGWWQAGDDLYTAGYGTAGFRVIAAAERRVGDVFLARVRSPVPNHGGVLWDRDLILHHTTGCASAIDPVYPWESLIGLWLRHASGNTP